MDADAIESETSGTFLVLKDKAPAGWVKLTASEAASIRGKGYSPIIPDWQNTSDDPCGEEQEEDALCDPPSANDGASEGGDDDPPGPPCCGMPEWRVSEPYINLWVHDTPLLYRLSSGKWMQFKITYKSRLGVGEMRTPNVGGFGDQWASDFLSMIQANTNAATRDYYTNYVAGGGLRAYQLDAAPHYSSRRVMGRIGNTLILKGPTGAERRHLWSYGYSSGVTNYFLTEKADRYGRRALINYETASLYGTNVVRATRLVDIDGRTNVISYTNVSFPKLITSIEDPYQRKAFFRYDHLGRLTNIIDAIGMSSSFQYDASNNLSKMVTPYGETTFYFLEGTNSTYTTWNRSLRVTEPNGQSQLYAYCAEGPEGVSDNWVDTRRWRQSYHWNRAQYEAISAQGKANLLDLPTDDYKKAELKKWLHLTADLDTVVSDTISVEASPEIPSGGRIERARYSYPGQLFTHFTGTLKAPSEISTPGGTAIQFQRNSWGRPVVTTRYMDGMAVSYTNTYDNSGRYLRKQNGPRGELVRGYGYHPVITNLLTSVTNAVGDWILYTHDTNTMKVVKVQFSSGLVRSNIYYSSGTHKGFLEKQINLNGSTPIRTNTFLYDKGNIGVQIDEMGLAVTNTWDSLNRLALAKYPDGTTLFNNYDKLDLVGTKDRLGKWTRYAYNNVRQMTGVTNANGAVTIYDYCGCGSPNSITQSNGTQRLVTTFGYDMLGRLTNTIYPDGYTVRRTYSTTTGLPEQISDTSGRYATLYHAQQGLGYRVDYATLNGSRALMAYTFDEYGRITNSVDENGVTTATSFDLLGRVVGRQTVGENAGAETFAYNSRGLTNHFDPLGKVTRFVRDESGRVLYQTNANNELLSFTYYPDDELKTLTDGRNSQTLWNRNAYGLVTSKTLMANQGGSAQEVLRYYYDAGGRLTNRWSMGKGGAGYNTYYAYDPVGNVTNIAYPTLTNTYRYDALNRLTNMTDSLGATTFTWTDGSQLRSEFGRWTADKVTWSYLHRQLTNTSLQRPGTSDWSQNYGYDSHGRLQTLSSPAGNFTYTYSASFFPFSWPYQISRQNGATAYISRDTIGRVSQLEYGGYVDVHEYIYDAASQRTQQVAWAYSPSYYYNYRDYTYDNIGQLKTAKGFDWGPQARRHEQFGYAYDASWNLLRRTNNNLVAHFQANGLNQVTNYSRTGTLTVSGSLYPPSSSASVTVSGTGLSLHPCGFVYGRRMGFAERGDSREWLEQLHGQGRG